MIRHRAVGAAIVAVTLLGGLGGCVRYYWSKPEGTQEQFNQASAECASEAKATSPSVKKAVFVHDLYRGCMASKGWVRDKQYEPPPPGWYRGIED